LHFKDLVPDENAKPNKKKSESKAMHDVPWGTGVGNIKGQLAELKRQNFHGAFCVEYEYHWDNSSPEIAEGIKFFDQQCAELSSTP
jgi:L-ribulose-5-phosphate 3-epimerase UlaE